MGKTILDMLAADPSVSPALKAVLFRRATATELTERRDDEAAAERQEARQAADAERDERWERGL